MAASTTTNPITTPLTFHPLRHHRKKEKIIVIMGATGTGKSRLSIDLATRYFPSEIINFDKMQVYKDLDITTNKISLHERHTIPHQFVFGGSNSRNYALLVEKELKRSLPWLPLSMPTSTFTVQFISMAPSINTITTPPTFQYPHRHHHKKTKIIVIMGATGTGKPRLSIYLATGFFPSEIINSDKIQVYKGLDIVTNKIAMHERQKIPHHFVVGGSNSYNYALLVEEELKRYPAQNYVSTALQILLPSVENQCILLAMGTSIAPASSYCRIASGSPLCEFEAYTVDSLKVMDLNGGFTNKGLKSAPLGFYPKGEPVVYQKTKYIKCSKGGRAENIRPGRIRRQRSRRNKKDKDDEEDGEDNRRPSDSNSLSLTLLIVLLLMLLLIVLSLILWLMS